MIIRIMGEGQLRLPEGALEELNRLDVDLESAVDKQDEAAFGVALALTAALTLYLSRTFTGRAIKAVAQDEPALRLMGANPVRIKQWAFGIATAVTALAGAMLIVVGPVEPSLDRVYIGRTFCVVVLAGLGSMTGTLLAGLILGVSESIVLTQFGASWAPAVAFGLLLIVLGLRPQGLFGR